MEPQGPDETSELRRLADEQLDDVDSDDEDRQRQGKRRRERVLELYSQGAINSAEDNYYAALVMLYGDEVAHFELARTFAKRSSTLGEPRAWSVIAAAWDRSLIMRGKPQRYGTQFIRENGRWSLGRVDPTVTDSQRAMYGVPPLWVQEQAVQRLQRREEEPD